MSLHHDTLVETSIERRNMLTLLASLQLFRGLDAETLVAIADVFGDVGAILTYLREDGSLGTIVSPALESAQRDYQEGEWWRHDIGMQRALELRYLATSDVVSDRDVASDQEMADHPFFRDFLIPHGLGWFAGVSVSPDPGATVVLTIQRSRAKAPFSDEERGMSLAERVVRFR